MKRKKEEVESESKGDMDDKEFKIGKVWIFDGEFDDEEGYSEENLEIEMDVDGEIKFENGVDVKMVEVEIEMVVIVFEVGGDGVVDEEEIDFLDVFMNAMVLFEVEKFSSSIFLVIEDGILVIKNNGKKSDY